MKSRWDFGGSWAPRGILDFGLKKASDYVTTGEDGNTEDESLHVRALRNYYEEDKTGRTRPTPVWLPPDPNAPVKAAPAQMVSSSSVPRSSYGMPQQQQPDTNSLRSRLDAAPSGYSSSSKASLIDSLPRNSQPVSAAPAALMSGSAKLKARLNNRTGTPPPNQGAANGGSASSLRAPNPYESSNGARVDDRPLAGGNYGWDQQPTRITHTPAEPTTSANAPWNGGGDGYNGFLSYSSSSPFGDAGRSGAGLGRQGLPSGPRSGMVRGPRGM